MGCNFSSIPLLVWLKSECNFNSLVPGRYGYDFKSVISKHMSPINSLASGGFDYSLK